MFAIVIVQGQSPQLAASRGPSDGGWLARRPTDPGASGGGPAGAEAACQLSAVSSRDSFPIHLGDLLPERSLPLFLFPPRAKQARQGPMTPASV